MTLTMADVLAHPSFRPGRPVMRGGARGLSRRVRWVHSSEVLEVASLLRGGELLLTGGELLAGASETEQRRYVRALAEREVAGVAIETGPHLPAIPAAMLNEADAVGLPVVELCRVVPFVGVTEAINGDLVNASVSRLRYGAELAHALSEVLTSGGGLTQLLKTVETRTGASAVVFDTSGDPLASSGSGSTQDTSSVSFRVTLRGIHTATLAFYPPPGADQELLTVAGERACEAIGLALLRTHSPSPRELAASELALLAATADRHLERLLHLGEIVGFVTNAPAIAIVIRGPATTSGLPGLDSVLRRHGTVALHLADGNAHAVVSLPGRRQAATARTSLMAALGEWLGVGEELVVTVGPVVPTLRAIGISMGAAIGCAEKRNAYGHSVLVDAQLTMAFDLLTHPEVSSKTEQLVMAQLGMLQAGDAPDQQVLLDTLEAYFDAGCNKTRCAEMLHLQRQSLYGRLDRAFALLGGDPTGTPRALPLHLALKLRHRIRV